MPFTRHLALATLALLLAACGGGEEGPANSAVTVTPALGKVWLATVRLRSLDGTLLAEGLMGSDGSIPLAGAGTGGVIVEIEGNDSAYYFDEGAGSARRLPAGRILHAVSATARSQIAVTALTELVYQRARALAGAAPLNATLITAAELEIAARFGSPAAGSFLAPPEVIDDARDLPDADTPAGRAALLLAGLAEHAFTRQLANQPDCANAPDCAPLLDFIDDLAADLRDGTLDGASHGIALASVFYDSASAATLPAMLQAATTTFQERVLAAHAIAVTDTRIGQAYQGEYTLTCALPGNNLSTRMRLQISLDGGFVVDGPFGRVGLPTGSSSASLLEVMDNRGYSRSGLAIPNLVITSIGLKPISDGISINVGGGGTDPIQIFLPPEEAPVFVAAGTYLLNGGFVLYRDQFWQCSGFPAPDSVILSTASHIESWLPDGSYDCETSDPGTIVSATVSAGHLGIGDSTWDFTSAQRHEEIQFGSLNLPPDHDDHTHVADVIAAARMPLTTLDISESESAEAPGNQLRLRRSVVTGATYFNASLNGVNYQHCLPDAPSSLQLNGRYSRYNTPITGERVDSVTIGTAGTSG